jgi:hydroxyacylglutathione hydrolase
VLHEEDLGNLLQPGSDGIPSPLQIKPQKPKMFLHDGDKVSIGQSLWRVIHTPGHSPGSISLFNEEAKLLFSGDTLFKGSIGNLSLPTGQPERMWPSLQKLAVLNPETRFYPGHGPTSTIGQEHWLTRAEELFS